MKSALKGRGTVVFVEPNLSGRGDEHPGQVVVGIHDHEQGRSIVAVVDPESASIVGVEDLPAQLQLGADERSEANARRSRTSACASSSVTEMPIR